MSPPAWCRAWMACRRSLSCSNTSTDRHRTTDTKKAIRRSPFLCLLDHFQAGSTTGPWRLTGRRTLIIVASIGSGIRVVIYAGRLQIKHHALAIFPRVHGKHRGSGDKQALRHTTKAPLEAHRVVIHVQVTYRTG